MKNAFQGLFVGLSILAVCHCTVVEKINSVK